MASYLLFIPIAKAYNAAPGAGTGPVAQWTYTVPNGKRAVVEHLFLLIDGNAGAANTLFGYYIATIGGIQIRLAEINGSGLAAPTFLGLAVNVSLSGGDSIAGITHNISAVNPVFFVHATIREYQ